MILVQMSLRLSQKYSLLKNIHQHAHSIYSVNMVAFHRGLLNELQVHFKLTTNPQELFEVQNHLQVNHQRIKSTSNQSNSKHNSIKSQLSIQSILKDNQVMTSVLVYLICLSIMIKILLFTYELEESVPISEELSAIIQILVLIIMKRKFDYSKHINCGSLNGGLKDLMNSNLNKDLMNSNINEKVQIRRQGQLIYIAQCDAKVGDIAYFSSGQAIYVDGIIINCQSTEYTSYLSDNYTITINEQFSISGKKSVKKTHIWMVQNQFHQELHTQLLLAQMFKLSNHNHQNTKSTNSQQNIKSKDPFVFRDSSVISGELELLVCQVHGSSNSKQMREQQKYEMACQGISQIKYYMNKFYFMVQICVICLGILLVISKAIAIATIQTKEQIEKDHRLHHPFEDMFTYMIRVGYSLIILLQYASSHEIQKYLKIYIYNNIDCEDYTLSCGLALQQLSEINLLLLEEDCLDKIDNHRVQKMGCIDMISEFNTFVDVKILVNVQPYLANSEIIMKSTYMYNSIQANQFSSYNVLSSSDSVQDKEEELSIKANINKFYGDVVNQNIYLPHPTMDASTKLDSIVNCSFLIASFNPKDIHSNQHQNSRESHAQILEICHQLGYKIAYLTSKSEQIIKPIQNNVLIICSAIKLNKNDLSQLVEKSQNDQKSSKELNNDQQIKTKKLNNKLKQQQSLKRERDSSYSGNLERFHQKQEKEKKLGDIKLKADGSKAQIALSLLFQISYLYARLYKIFLCLLLNNAMEVLILCFVTCRGTIFEIEYNLIVIIFCLRYEVHEIYSILVSNKSFVSKDMKEENQEIEEKPLIIEKVNFNKILAFNCILFASYIFIIEQILEAPYQQFKILMFLVSNHQFRIQFFIYKFRKTSNNAYFWLKLVLLFFTITLQAYILASNKINEQKYQNCSLLSLMCQLLLKDSYMMLIPTMYAMHIYFF